MLQPWTVDAWIAFLSVLVDGLGAIAWPITVVASLWMFRRAIAKLISRTKKVSLDSAEFTPIDQSIDEQPAGLSEVLKSNYGQDEEHLRPWLTRIREDIRNLDEAKSDQLDDLLVVALAKAQQRTDFFDILLQIFGSQILLLTKVSSAGFVSEATIEEYYSIYLNRAGEHSGEKEDWIGFLTNLSLVKGDEHRIEITIHGKDFVSFLEGMGYHGSRRPM